MHDEQRTTHDDGWWPIAIGHPGDLKNRNQRRKSNWYRDIDLVLNKCDIYLFIQNNFSILDILMLHISNDTNLI